MHLHYTEEGKVSTESNIAAEAVTTALSTSPPAAAAEQSASGKDKGKKMTTKSSGHIADATNRAQCDNLKILNQILTFSK